MPIWDLKGGQCLVHLEREVKPVVFDSEAHSDHHTEPDWAIPKHSQHSQAFWHAELLANGLHAVAGPLTDTRGGPVLVEWTDWLEGQGDLPVRRDADRAANLHRPKRTHDSPAHQGFAPARQAELPEELQQVCRVTQRPHLRLLDFTNHQTQADEDQSASAID